MAFWRGTGFILDLLPIPGGGTAHKQGPGHACRSLFAEHRLLVAEADIQRSGNRATAGLLWKHHQVQSVGQGGPDDTGLDVLRGWIERLTRFDGGAAFVVLEAFGWIGGGGNFGTIRSGSGDE